MNAISMQAMSDEFFKIAKAGKAVAWAGKHLKEVGKNLKGAVSDLKSPVKSVKREVGAAKKDIKSLVSGKKGAKGRTGRLVGHGLNLGMTGLMAHSALKKNDETGEGQSRAKRVARLAGSTLGGLATARRGFTGGILGSVAGDQAGRLVGSAADKLTGHKKSEA